MLSCENKSRTRYQFWHLSISKKAQLPAVRITEQLIVLTKRKNNHRVISMFVKIRTRSRHKDFNYI